VEHPLDPPHRHFLGGGGRRLVVVERAGLGLGDVAIGEAAHHHQLHAAERPADAQRVADPDLAVGLGDHAVHLDLAVAAGLLRFGPRAEQARHVEPDVEAHGRG
jgi:hypothetical protein